ncbi:DDE-type integrase/transposase/recombinase [Corynebacterium macginleyi]|uniref:DDE-type integrase/transposase/recombinase n=1 Tax=Corynebacterium macginleyi TaxID=38290 RepID=UPI003084201C
MPDLLDRKFSASAPNRVYVGDITYLPCKGGTNMYLATVIDTYSRTRTGYGIRRPHAGLTGHRCSIPRTWCAWQS